LKSRNQEVCATERNRGMVEMGVALHRSTSIINCIVIALL